MGFNVYSAEYKMATVEEYISHNIKVRDFVKEKGLAISSITIICERKLINIF